MQQECYLLESSPVFSLNPYEEKHINLALEPVCPPDNRNIVKVCIKIKICTRCNKRKKRFTFKSCSKDNEVTFRRFFRLLRRKLERLRSNCPNSEITIKGRLKIKTTTSKLKQKFSYTLPVEEFLDDAQSIFLFKTS